MLAGILMVLVYAVVLVALMRRAGVPYSEIPASEENTRRAVLVPVAVALSLLLVFALATGRLAGAFTYSPTVSAAWLWAVPGLMLLGIVLRLSTTSWSQLGARRVLVLVVAMLLVGLSEELLVRGLFVDYLQEAGVGAVWVAVISSVVFGLVHGLNVFLGQDVASTLLQVVLSALMGLALFTGLALSGTLWLPIVLHALFDLSLLAQGSVVRTGAQIGRLETLTNLLPTVLAIGVLFAL